MYLSYELQKHLVSFYLPLFFDYRAPRGQSVKGAWYASGLIGVERYKSENAGFGIRF